MAGSLANRLTGCFFTIPKIYKQQHNIIISYTVSSDQSKKECLLGCHISCTEVCSMVRPCSWYPVPLQGSALILWMPSYSEASIANSQHIGRGIIGIKLLCPLSSLWGFKCIRSVGDLGRVLCIEVFSILRATMGFAEVNIEGHAQS